MDKITTKLSDFQYNNNSCVTLFETNFQKEKQETVECLQKEEDNSSIFDIENELNTVRKTIRNMGIAELCTGIICVIVGAVILACDALYNRNQEKVNTTGEGVWCGVWIVAAGVSGIAAGKADSSIKIVKTHVALSILAAIFCFVMLVLGFFFRYSLSEDSFTLAIASLVFYMTLYVFGSVSLILLVASTLYTYYSSHVFQRPNLQNYQFNARQEINERKQFPYVFHNIF